MPDDRSPVQIILVIASLAIGSTWFGGTLAQGYTASDSEEDVSFWAELAFWESVKDSQDPNELKAYVDAYPQGRFATLAQLRIKALQNPPGGFAGEGGASADPKRTLGPGAAGGQGESGTMDGEGEDGLTPGETFSDCDMCPTMVVVPAGSFDMGSDHDRPEEKPQHRVDIAYSFAIGTGEVTIEEWDACLREGGCRQTPPSGRDGKLPMANLSWNDAQSYVKWLSDRSGQDYRLPSESEWEYAARAGTESAYWWGDGKGVKQANCKNCGNPFDGKDASASGSFPANPFGLYDVHGNVWEWTQDCWNPSYRGAPVDGQPWLRGDCLSRVLRSGSWALGQDYMRSSRRSRYDRDVRYYLNGLRVVREIAAPAGKPEEEGLPRFESAVLQAAGKVFSEAPGASPGRRKIVLDPLIDGMSGAETVATQAMESVIVDLVRRSYTGFDVEEFTLPNLSGSRFAVIGTFTGVNKQRKTSGIREAFRICLVMLDMQSGKVAAKAKVFSQVSGVDITPTKFFRDSPVWIADPTAQAYIRSCQATKPGDPIDPLYLERFEAGALISEAIDAYDQGQYRKSQDLFKLASRSAAGDQLRVYNGLYLASWKLDETAQAADAFSRLIDFGLGNSSFSIALPFKAGSTDLQVDPKGGQPDFWLAQIAKETASRGLCLEVVGHTHSLGPELLNQRLAVRRAEYVKQRLEAAAPELANRIIATGKGTEANLIGSRTGDASDELDRRMEIAVIQCETGR